jgi:hypothetical protein
MARARRAASTKAISGGSKKAISRRSKKKQDAVVAKDIPYTAGEVVTQLIMKPSSQGYRHGDYVHVSDLVGKCLRKVAVSDKHHLPIPLESIWPSLRLTFAQGVAMADTMVEDAIRQAPDLVYARWSCQCGEVEDIGTHQDKFGRKECTDCLTATTKYNELTFRDEEYAVIGNCDLTLYFNDAFYINEIKSIAGEAWKTLEAPKPEHLLQAMFYWWLAKRNNLQLHDKISIIYASKAFVFGNPYKEFTVQPSKFMHRLEEYLEDAKALKEYKWGGKMPIKVECATIECTTAKNCHISGPCFDEWAAGN